MEGKKKQEVFSLIRQKAKLKKKFYITTAIDYVNAEPHIGHAYQKIAADILSRWHKLIGDDVFFVTGTDEHGKKISDSAKQSGKTLKEFVDEMSEKFREAWKSLNIQPDRFIRTTDKDHEKVVNEFIKKCDKSKDIYKGEYEGLYCVGCERYYTEKDLVDGKCSFHPNRKVENIKEETYFFKLSKYQKFLLESYKIHPEFVLPSEIRNDVITRVKEGIKDLSITRTNFEWGIPFVFDKKHVLYVWFEALISYYTATREKGREKFWGKPTVHLLGKDNTWFHCVIWPAMLKSAGIDLPKTIFNHGFLTFNGQKISKSLGNVISPKVLVEKYGADSIRYFVCRQFPFASGNDGDFSEKALIERHNNELADKLGNLVSRVSALIEKYGVEKAENKLLKKLKLKEIEKLFESYELDKSLNEIFSFIDECNTYIQHKKPWETKDKKVLYEAADSIKAIAILLW
ncbi:MAG: methionine--tRNA ligase, partial [Nanoarchaeota archaeon]